MLIAPRRHFDCTETRILVSRLATAPGHLLEAGAAASWDLLAREVRRRHGWMPMLTGSVRTYADQVRLFRERYQTAPVAHAPGRYDRRVWQGTRYWRKPGCAASAVPGASNHGFGRAVDVAGLGGFDGTRYGQLAEIANAHGWDNRAGRAVDEPWHWERSIANDTYRRENEKEGYLSAPSCETPGGRHPSMSRRSAGAEPARALPLRRSVEFFGRPQFLGDS